MEIAGFQINYDFSNIVIECMVVNGSNIFIGTFGQGIFLSTNNGMTWRAMNNGLTDRNVLTIAASGDKIFAGTWFDGVFLSTNNGETWKAINNGLAILRVDKIKICDSVCIYRHVPSIE
jgi:ligand-binding sensor domain-containing protein